MIIDDRKQQILYEGHYILNIEKDLQIKRIKTNMDYKNGQT